MTAPLNEITRLSVYKNAAGLRVVLPKRMARCTPDMEKAIQDAGSALEARGGHLYLSDLFRSYDMQFQSHMDFVNKKKTAFSPPPGGSLHEAGRALDLDLDNIKVKLSDFWDIAKSVGLSPIINKPTPGVSESWHFDCRGSHQIVYDHYQSGKGGTNFKKPYAAMAASAILAIGVKVDQFGPNQTAAAIQSALIRLGQNIGSMDGSIGKNTKDGLAAVGVSFSADLPAVSAALEELLRESFPNEYETSAGSEPIDFGAAPKHVIQ
jgi:D-alanyl-D-alanine dipeptidase